MSVVLDTTVGGANANSYCSLADAAAYNDNHPYGSDWAGSDDTLSRALILATALLDQHVEWKTGRGWIPSAGLVGGGVVSMTQRLLWPRYGVLGRNGFVIDSTVIPTEVRDATAEFARLILAKDPTLDSKTETQGIASMKTGPLEFTFDNPRAKVIPDSVFYKIQHLGSIIQRGVGSMPVTRA